MTDDGPARGPSGPTEREEERLADTFGHLQEAALAMLAAARSALDAAERLARNPAPLLDMVAEASRAARAQAPPSSHADGDVATRSSGPRQSSGPGSALSPRPRVQHVVVTPPVAATADPEDGAGGGQGPQIEVAAADPP